MEYKIRKSSLPEALKRIGKANRRLERAGITERFEVTTREYLHRDKTSAVLTEMVELTLNRPSISYEGWTFVGAHQSTPDGNIVSYGSGERAVDMRCEHCGHNRPRSAVYTLRHESGDTAQVGSSCMKDFLGIAPAGLWALTADPVDVDELDEKYPLSSGQDEAYPAVLFLSAILSISENGSAFVPRSKATDQHPATVTLFFRDAGVLLDQEHSMERTRLAEAILEWVGSLPEGASSYEDNLRAVLAGTDRIVSRRHAGLAASAVSAYLRAQERVAERKRDEDVRVPGFVADVGVRVRDVPVEVVKVIYLGESSYGYRPQERWLIGLRTDEGKSVVWFANGSHGHYERGERCLMAATVKAHEQHEGRDQTVVQRVKLSER